MKSRKVLFYNFVLLESALGWEIFIDDKHNQIANCSTLSQNIQSNLSAVFSPFLHLMNIVLKGDRSGETPLITSEKNQTRLEVYTLLRIYPHLFLPYGE